VNPQREDLSWKQHFPTYHFENRDIALKEYDFATKTLEAEERVFLNAVNVSVAVGAALGSLALGSLDKLAASFSPMVPEAFTLGLLLLLAGAFARILLRYFADRQKAVVFAARKVIVLRRMLGMSYGSLQLVLPNWRIEGADEPFAVRLFPGWHTYVAYPCLAVSGISSAVAFFILSAIFRHMQVGGVDLPFSVLPLLIGAASLWFVVLCWTYRKALLDTHEHTLLLLAQRVAAWLGLSLVPNIEYIIYRATLAIYELHRIGCDLKRPQKLLVHIEDKEFYDHFGISLRGLGRLVLSMVGRHRRSGGSTITQQLVRSLFIKDQSKLIRRKIVEIVLALWFNKAVSKAVQLQMYLASVRFESGVFGLSAAMKYFFEAVRESPSSAESFFLIERVSNIRSRLLVPKIDQTLRGSVAAGVLTEQDVMEVIALYSTAIGNGKIEDPDGSAIIRLKAAWAKPNNALNPRCQDSW
jgi:penicillin-binding protein 1A